MYSTGIDTSRLNQPPSKHYAVLLTCKKLYNKALALVYQHTTLVVNFLWLVSTTKTITRTHKEQVQQIRYAEDCCLGCTCNAARFLRKFTPYRKLQKVILPDKKLFPGQMSEDIGDKDIWHKLDSDEFDDHPGAVKILLSKFPELVVSFGTHAYGYDVANMRRVDLVSLCGLRMYLNIKTECIQLCDMVLTAEGRKVVRKRMWSARV